MSNVYDILKERGYIKQLTHEEEIRELLGKEKISFYIGFDPTADSLHVGHFLQMMVMAHMQKAGHRPIALVGGGTGMIGDPTGKTDMRKMMTKEQIEHNCNCFKKQLAKIIDFSEDKAIMVNNADWLLNLNYIEFLREIGVHFSVNKMLTAECFKSRLEKGLSFLEFNYMLMQGYDFLELNRKYNCVMELGGDDQWSNILAGVDLIRRKESKSAYGMTFTLLTNSEGKKMGKTESGALWLDPEKTSPYEFYQYWRNVADADVEKCLRLITFLPMDEVRRLSSLEGAEINEAKKVLAFEVTKLIHGEEEAQKAKIAAEALFGGNAKDLGNMPTAYIDKNDLNNLLVDLLVKCEILPSKSEARRLIKQGGLYLNDEKVTDMNLVVTEEHVTEDGIMIRRGKKNFNRIVVE
ncbi:tyrosine--tRNA ligase [Clostridium botulinum]|uniref:Tyrosine--tRNA ligase n=2 Tax=Clostridium botulinum A TaxID=36826 RepID=SYY_CLOBH|nr:tyrosine--tRNA ligase [Clostridium botulinum]A5I748.1 RecName: Full=Tyrosine--tRNA ligase; AltName: Full=Tyrosyl-tRNA synthetase; Short=TyrRS [Clostridium botulinum A str. Hall]A7FYR9.1 RecName: Full=Tyrosine--tRNA ligase; AltName: Full=Tyrosyl-tRNA synthetase; Short=TyrRS [Clostridium botulinum A str. ATCC 19397]ABS35460.1 tyrosyl-tRNA synthetase [Clostridium botulinum A str. ATCC 19397]ABS36295.1 tyrosine--tRNA ligase [Clostridium botulinum A str. Hall]AWB19129.1 tyrosine--tRNA ligase [Cl